MADIDSERGEVVADMAGELVDMCEDAIDAGSDVNDVMAAMVAVLAYMQDQKDEAREDADLMLADVRGRATR